MNPDVRLSDDERRAVDAFRARHVVPGQWLPVECWVCWQGSFFSPQISWTCSKGSFANPSAAATTYAAAGQTGADTLHVVLDEPARGLHAEISKTVTIWPDHLARDYGNMNTLNQWADRSGWGNCQMAANHAWCGNRLQVQEWHPPWGGQPFHAQPDEHYPLLFDRQQGITTYLTYTFTRGSVVCVGKGGWGPRDLKTVLTDGIGEATSLFGKEGGKDWRVLAVKDLLEETGPGGGFLYDWMVIAAR